jgi:type III restriction enzyme
MIFCDNDSKTRAIIKINENYHYFAKINYVRSDGMLSQYSPDFIVKTEDTIYVVETKAQEYMSTDNVKLKQLAAVDWTERVNKLNPVDRMELPWTYVLLGENTFYNMQEKGADINEILNYAKLSRNAIKGTLF